LRSPSAPSRIALPRGEHEGLLVCAQAVALAAPAEMFQARYACGHLYFPALEMGQ
jgi:hypothetical protein